MQIRSRGKIDDASASRRLSDVPHRDEEDNESPRGRSLGYKKKRRRSRPVSIFQVCTACTLSIALLIFTSSVDFQRDKKHHSSVANQGSTALRKSPPKQSGVSSSSTSGQNAALSAGSCRYDGHCGVSKTCAVAGGGIGGSCESFASTGNANSAASTVCFDTCLKELQLDEHWYHEQWPVVDWSEDVTSQGRPKGCLIVYHREPQGDHFKYLEEEDKNQKALYEGIPPSLVTWVNTRFHHIKRVDPLNDDARDNRWQALCTAPCQSDVDCTTRNDGDVPGFICIESACLRNPLFWGPDVPSQATPREQMDAAADMVLVTGATDSYFAGLTNLAASARYWAPQYKMVVYNLGGISPENVAKIRSWSNVLAVEWEDGIPSHYPPHVHEGKKYAWKPIIVNETVHKYGSIFWLDSGSTLAGPIQPIQKVLQHQGIALVKGQDIDMRPKASEKSFEWFGYDKRSMAVGPHFSGNTQAFLYPSRYIDTVVFPNCKCALDENCISPPGSHLGSHRYDQTTISILAYAPKTKLPHYTEYLAASNAQLNPDLLKPSFKFVWTSRQGCHFYAQRDAELQGKPA